MGSHYAISPRKNQQNERKTVQNPDPRGRIHPTPELMKAVEEAHEASATYEMVDTEFKKLASNRKPKQPKV